jgi:hypothetical protein
VKNMGFRHRRFARGPGIGRRFYRGAGYGRRYYSPNCDWYPDLPRGWWAMPEYQDNAREAGWVAPPTAARWDPYGKPNNPEAVEHEISLIQKQIEALQDEIEYLKDLKLAKE